MSNHSPLQIAVVCASNMNRSMEAHALLSKKGFFVKSYGTSTRVKLPGLSANNPNTYSFGVTYEDILQDLKEKDFDGYTRNGLIYLADRNRKIKKAPEKWQETDIKFDLIITFEARIFEQVCEDLESRPQNTYKPVYIVNLNTTDNREEALIGAKNALLLCQGLQSLDDWQEEFEDFIDFFSNKLDKELLFSLMYY
eukprot:GCRY01006715.1.p1 GENE.GCRY01006715.1~~GCRY01006715.1.p1  ORF type:complete len:196 (+),score=17.02 GCRY01006715.1:143-730(+)